MVGQSVRQSGYSAMHTHHALFCVVVPAGCSAKEACAPVDHLHIEHVFPMCACRKDYSSENYVNADSPMQLQPTPLGVNPTKSPATEGYVQESETFDNSTKSRNKDAELVSPTQDWSEGKPITNEMVKATPSYRRACDIGTLTSLQKVRAYDVREKSDGPRVKVTPIQGSKHQSPNAAGLDYAAPRHDQTSPCEKSNGRSLAAPYPDNNGQTDKFPPGNWAHADGGGGNLWSPTDSLSRCVEGDRCILGKEDSLQSDGSATAGGSKEDADILNNQSILPPKPQILRGKPVATHQRSTSGKKRSCNSQGTSTMLARSVSPTIAKTQE